MSKKEHRQLIERGRTINYIPLKECKHGYLYRIDSRNLTYGVYNKPKKGFAGIRTKFSERFVFTEYHWDTGEPFGTVKPIKCIEKCLIENLNDWIEIDRKHVKNNEKLMKWLELTTSGGNKRSKI